MSLYPPCPHGETTLCQHGRCDECVMPHRWEEQPPEPSPAPSPRPDGSMTKMREALLYVSTVHESVKRDALAEIEQWESELEVMAGELNDREAQPDTTASEPAETVRQWIADYTDCDCDEDFICLIHRTAPHLDALLAEVEQLERERDEWKQRYVVAAKVIDDTFPDLANEIHKRQERAEAAEIRLERMTNEANTLAEKLQAAEALTERRASDLLLARSELDWCIGYAATAEHEVWREPLLKRLHVVMVLLADGGQENPA